MASLSEDEKWPHRKVKPNSSFTGLIQLPSIKEEHWMTDFMTDFMTGVLDDYAPSNEFCVDQPKLLGWLWEQYALIFDGNENAHKKYKADLKNSDFGIKGSDLLGPLKDYELATLATLQYDSETEFWARHRNEVIYIFGLFFEEKEKSVISFEVHDHCGCVTEIKPPLKNKIPEHTMSGKEFVEGLHTQWFENDKVELQAVQLRIEKEKQDAQWMENYNEKLRNLHANEEICITMEEFYTQWMENYNEYL